MLWLTAYGLVGCVAYQRAVSPLDKDIWTTTELGGTFGAMGLVTAWLVFGRTPAAIRSLLSVIALFTSSWLLSRNSQGSEAGTMAWLTIQMPQVIAAFIGLAVLRLYGLRLRGPGDAVHVVPSETSRRYQFSLNGLLRMVGGVALFLGMGRWLGSYDAIYIVVCAILGGTATLAVALVWLRGFVLLRCGFGVLALSVLVGGFCSGPVAYLDPRAVASLSLTMLLFMTVSLAVFRVCGYRLERIPKAGIEASGKMPEVGETADSPVIPVGSRL